MHGIMFTPMLGALVAAFFALLSFKQLWFSLRLSLTKEKNIGRIFSNRHVHKVVLQGTANAGPEGLIVSPFSQKPCCYYWVKIYDQKLYDKNNRTPLKQYRSRTPLEIVTATGRYWLSPRGATVEGAPTEETWTSSELINDAQADTSLGKIIAKPNTTYLYKETRITADTPIFLYGKCQIKNAVDNNAEFDETSSGKKLKPLYFNFIISAFCDQKKLVKKHFRTAIVFGFTSVVLLGISITMSCTNLSKIFF